MSEEVIKLEEVVAHMLDDIEVLLEKVKDEMKLEVAISIAEIALLNGSKSFQEFVGSLEQIKFEYFDRMLNEE